MARIAMICAGALLIGAAPALSQGQQSRVLTVSADAPFAHANSGLSMPATLIGLSRFEVRELESPELDVWARYRRDDTEELTVYVYRAIAGAVPVWFDRAANAVETRAGFGTPTAIAPTRAIIPPGAASASALMQSWSVTNGGYTGTSLLIAPLGEWLVKLRYSTKAGDGAAAEAKLMQALSTLGWPATIPAAQAAAAVVACPDALVFKGNAKPAKVDGASALLGAVLGGIVAEESKTAVSDTIWCRDPGSVTGPAIYRANGSDRSYLLALSDAGRGVSVGPNEAGLLMGKSRPNWSIDLILPGRTLNYPPLDRLPSPKRVMEVLDGNALSSTSTWKDSNITISSDSLK